MEKKQAIRYFALIQALYYASTGLWNYLNIYLREIGFSPRQLGNVSAVGILAAMIVLPLMGILADKIRSPKKLFTWFLGLMLPLLLLYPAMDLAGVRWLLPYMVLTVAMLVCTRVPAAFLESWNGMEMERLGVSYGVIRRFGSLGFVIICLGSSAVVGSVLPTWSCCVIMAVVGLPLLWLVRKPGAETAAAQVPKKEKFSGKEVLSLVFGNYYFLIFLLLHLGFCAFQGTVNLCLSYLMDYAGAPNAYVGILSGYRAAVEIGAMFWLSSTKRKPPHWVILSIACLLVAAEHLIYPWTTSFPALVAASTLTGIGGGLYFGISANFVLQTVDNRAANTAMSVQAVINGAAGIAGTALGGIIIDAYGVTALTTGVGVLTLVTTAIFAGGILLGRRVWKIPLRRHGI